MQCVIYGIIIMQMSNSFVLAIFMLRLLWSLKLVNSSFNIVTLFFMPLHINFCKICLLLLDWDWFRCLSGRSIRRHRLHASVQSLHVRHSRLRWFPTICSGTQTTGNPIYHHCGKYMPKVHTWYLNLKTPWSAAYIECFFFREISEGICRSICL